MEMEELDPIYSVERLLEAYERAGMCTGMDIPSASVESSSNTRDRPTGADQNASEYIRNAMEGLCLSLCLRGNEFRAYLPLEKLVELVCMSQQFTNDTTVVELSVRALAITADTIIKGAEVIASGVGGGMELILTLLGDIDYLVQHRMLVEEVLQCLCAVTPRLPASSPVALGHNVGREQNSSHMSSSSARVRAALAHQIVRLHDQPMIQSSATLSVQCLTALDGLLQGEDFGDASAELKQFWRGAVLRGMREFLDQFLPEPEVGFEAVSTTSSTHLGGEPSLARPTSSSSAVGNSRPGSRRSQATQQQQQQQQQQTRVGNSSRHGKKEGTLLLIKYFTCLACYCDRLSSKRLKLEEEQRQHMASGNARDGNQNALSVSERMRRKFSFTLFGRGSRRRSSTQAAEEEEEEANTPEERFFLWHVTLLCVGTIRRSAVHCRGDDGDSIRSAACSPLLALFRTAPDVVLPCFVRARVVEVLCSVAVSLLDGVPNNASEEKMPTVETPPLAMVDSIDDDESRRRTVEDDERVSTPVHPPHMNSSIAATSVTDGPPVVVAGVIRRPGAASMSSISSDANATSSHPHNPDGHSEQQLSGADDSAAPNHDASLNSPPHGPVGPEPDAQAQGQGPSPMDAFGEDHLNSMPLIASELSVLPLLEFLLVLLPPPRSYFGHGDFANVTVPFNSWAWEDQLCQLHSCGERLSTLLEMIYQSGKFDSPQHLLPLYWKEIQERYHEELASNRRHTEGTRTAEADAAAAAAAAAMLGSVPCQLHRHSLITGYVHGRLNGLQKRRAHSTADKKARSLQCRCTRRRRWRIHQQQRKTKAASPLPMPGGDIFNSEGLPLGSALNQHAAAAASDGATVQDDFWRLDGVEITRTYTGEMQNDARQRAAWNSIFEQGLSGSHPVVEQQQTGSGDRNEGVDELNLVVNREDKIVDEQKNTTTSSKCAFSMSQEEGKEGSSCGSSDDDDHSEESSFDSEADTASESASSRQGVDMAGDEEDPPVDSCWGWCCQDTDDSGMEGVSNKNTAPKISFDYVTHRQLGVSRRALQTEESLKMLLSTCVPTLLLLVEKTVNPLIARHCAVLLLRSMSLWSHSPIMAASKRKEVDVEAMQLQTLKSRDVEAREEEEEEGYPPPMKTVLSGPQRTAPPPRLVAAAAERTPEKARLEALLDAVESRLLHTAVYLLRNPVEGGNAFPLMSLNERVTPFRLFESLCNYRERLCMRKGISTRLKAVSFTFTAEMRLASADIILFLLHRKQQQHPPPPPLERTSQDVCSSADALPLPCRSPSKAGVLDESQDEGSRTPPSLNPFLTYPKPPLAVVFGSCSRAMPYRAANKKDESNREEDGVRRHTDQVLHWMQAVADDRRMLLTPTTYKSLCEAMKELTNGLVMMQHQIAGHVPPTNHTVQDQLPTSEVALTSFEAGILSAPFASPQKLSTSQKNHLIFYLPGPSCPFHATPLSLIRRFLRVLQVLESSVEAYMRTTALAYPPVPTAGLGGSSSEFATAMRMQMGLCPAGMKPAYHHEPTMTAAIRTLFQQEMNRQSKCGVSHALRAALAIYALTHPTPTPSERTPHTTTTGHGDHVIAPVKCRTTVSSHTFGAPTRSSADRLPLGGALSEGGSGGDHNPYVIGPNSGASAVSKTPDWVTLELIAEYYPEAFLQAAQFLVQRGQGVEESEQLLREDDGDVPFVCESHDLLQRLSDAAPPLSVAERPYSAPLQSLLDDVAELLSSQLQFIAPDQGFTVLDGQPSRFAKRKRTEKGKLKGMELALSTALYVRLTHLLIPETYFSRLGIPVEEVTSTTCDCVTTPSSSSTDAVENEKECTAGGEGGKRKLTPSLKKKSPVVFSRPTSREMNSQSRLSDRSPSSSPFKRRGSRSLPPAVHRSPVVKQICIQGYPLRYYEDRQPMLFFFLLLPRITLATLAACICNRVNAKNGSDTSSGAVAHSSPLSPPHRRLHFARNHEGSSSSSPRMGRGDGVPPSPPITPRHVLFVVAGHPVISPLSTLAEILTSFSPVGAQEVFEFQRRAERGTRKKRTRQNRQKSPSHREAVTEENNGGEYEVTGVQTKLHHISFIILSDPMPWELFAGVPCGCRQPLCTTTKGSGGAGVESPTSTTACNAEEATQGRMNPIPQHYCNPAHLFGGTPSHHHTSDDGTSTADTRSLWSLMEALVTTLRCHTTTPAASSFFPTTTMASNTSVRSTTFASHAVPQVGRLSTGVNLRRIYSALMHLMYRSIDIFMMPSLLYGFGKQNEYSDHCRPDTFQERGILNSEGGNVLDGKLSMVALWTYPLIFSHEMRMEIFYVLMQCQRNTIFPRLQRRREMDERPIDAPVEALSSLPLFDGAEHYPPTIAFTAQNLDWLLDDGVSLHTQRISVEVTRDPEFVLPVGCSILQRYANCPFILDFSYREEPGIGLGPALEFFESFARVIETDASLGMWRTEEVLMPTLHVKKTSSSSSSSSKPINRNGSISDEGRVEQERKRSAEANNVQTPGPKNDIVPAASPRLEWAEKEDAESTESVETIATERSLREDAPPPSGYGRRVLPLLFPSPYLSEDSLSLFFSLGLYLGRLLHMRRTTLLRFHPLMLKVLRDNSLLASTTSDASTHLQMLDPHLEKSLRSLENMSSEELIAMDLNFVLPGSENDGVSGVELEPNGKSINVCSDNVRAYTFSVRRYHLDVPLRKALFYLRHGLVTTIHPSYLYLFSVPELDVLLSGKEGKLWEYPQDLAPSVIASHGYTLSSRMILDFLDVVTSWSATQQRLFLRFLTGCSTIGSSGLQPPITIVRRDVGDESAPRHLCETGENSGVDFAQQQVDGTLPSVSTCFHYLKLPQYSCREVLEDRLLNAITDGQGSFDLS